jgi:hypothetical protein
VAVSPQWAPGEAYLAGRRKAKADRLEARKTVKPGHDEQE